MLCSFSHVLFRPFPTHRFAGLCPMPVTIRAHLGYSSCAWFLPFPTHGISRLGPIPVAISSSGQFFICVVPPFPHTRDCYPSSCSLLSFLFFLVLRIWKNRSADASLFFNVLIGKKLLSWKLLERTNSSSFFMRQELLWFGFKPFFPHLWFFIISAFGWY